MKNFHTPNKWILLTNLHTPYQRKLLTNLCTLSQRMLLMNLHTPNHLSIQGGCHAPYDESLMLPLHPQNNATAHMSLLQWQHTKCMHEVVDSCHNLMQQPETPVEHAAIHTFWADARTHAHTPYPSAASSYLPPILSFSDYLSQH